MLYCAYHVIYVVSHVLGRAGPHMEAAESSCTPSVDASVPNACELKRRRVSRGNDESPFGSTSPELVSTLPLKTLSVERPARAASSSPHFTNYRENRDEEFNLDRSRPLRASVGHGCAGSRPTLSHGFASTPRVSSSYRTREPRYPSPSDFLSHSFLKQAVIFDRNVQLKKFLEGGLWTRLRNGNTPPRTSSPQSEPVPTNKPVSERKSKTTKRKRDP
ncbi:unnamed protein product [Cylicocyclus nassatus]|uniref:Uncharacterized protein n=1 Tax=Cylicocyclus nassatus TaxID=53992 RepID=A0AA36MD87_CYLNA|nr:unnamed protein product [Cylicocyclus nassatus]